MHAHPHHQRASEPCSPEAAFAASDEWARHVEGMRVLADLAQGRQAEEGMRRHYLALMKLCAASMGSMLPPQSAPS